MHTHPTVSHHTHPTASHHIPCACQINDRVFSMLDIEVSPAGAYLPKCSVEVVGGVWSVVAGSILIFTVTVCDQFGNRRSEQKGVSVCLCV